MAGDTLYIILMPALMCGALSTSRVFVKYEITSETNKSSICILQQLLVEDSVLINDTKNDTDIVKENCSSDIRRVVTVETFENWFETNTTNRTEWILPSKFDYGSRLEISFMVPNGPDWFSFCFALHGLGLQLARICIRSSANIAIHQYSSQGPTGDQNFYTQLKTGILHTCVITARTSYVEVTVGNSVFAELDYVIQPTDCHILTSELKGTSIPTVSKITLISP